MFHFLGTAGLGIALSWLIYIQFFQYLCRCQPWESCWPSDEQWDFLNRSMEFNLVRLVPTASVCYKPSLNNPMCEEVMRMSKDSGWRASQPGKPGIYIPPQNFISQLRRPTRCIAGLGMGGWPVRCRHMPIRISNEGPYRMLPRAHSSLLGNGEFY